MPSDARLRERLVRAFHEPEAFAGAVRPVERAGPGDDGQGRSEL